MSCVRILIILLSLFFLCCSEKNNQTVSKNSTQKSLLNVKTLKINTTNQITNDRIYSTFANLNVMKTTDTKSPVITKIRNNFWYYVVQRTDKWIKIKLNNGREGYVDANYVTNYWLKVLKSEREIHLMKNWESVRVYPIGLGFNPVGDKKILGDGCTANGRFYIVEMLKNPQPQSRYGAKSLRLSYPNIEDARRGLKSKIISKTQYLDIVKAIYNGKIPLQNTKLGGSLRIHGGGSGKDWTLGCMALDDKHIIDLYSRLTNKNMMVDIYMDEKEYQKLKNRFYANYLLLKGAKKLLTEKLVYTEDAIKIIKLKFPMGDLNRNIGVCTDVIIRALRFINIDLQALLYEDIIMNPSRYKNIITPNTNIDHRRVRNLKIWLDHYTISVNGDWKPGDIVLLDTGVKNGTIYDHIGIVS
ncbi:MAG: DUF1287 domain-containing protein, partial [Spirochaetota bacterium]|nr:DUF1287 domain-containing protein [Spirochaetota bacterium]